MGRYPLEESSVTPANSNSRQRRSRPPDHGGFRPIGGIARQVVDDIGRRSIAHWLAKAAAAEGEDREAAFKVADDLRQKMQVSWGDLVNGGKAA